MPETARLRESALALHRHLAEEHWDGEALVGPDPGIRFNARLYRFAKSYLRPIPWRDDLVYMQAQKYWIQSLWLLEGMGLGDEATEATAVACARFIRRRQRPEGYWDYPNPEWRGRIATVEGNYACMGLLMTHERTGDDDLLDGARRWYRYAVDEIGFQVRGGTYAINYFGNVPGGRVPNNSASAVRAFAMLARATGDPGYLEHCGPMVRFMAESQLPSGELPYSVTGVTGRDRIHFLCQNYNAFQFLNLLEYHRLTADPAAWEILERLVPFLAEGLTPAGYARHDCHDDDPEVVYYTAAVGAALTAAADAGLGDHREQASAAFRRLLSHQAPDGGFPYSFRNYRILSDRRSYPRYLAMILTHLLMEVESRSRREAGEVSAGETGAQVEG